jgi:hypothetical protein
MHGIDRGPLARGPRAHAWEGRESHGSASPRSARTSNQRPTSPLVVDHDRGVVVWGAEGRDSKTLDEFFNELRSVPEWLLPVGLIREGVLW